MPVVVEFIVYIYTNGSINVLLLNRGEVII